MTTSQEDLANDWQDEDVETLVDEAEAEPSSTSNSRRSFVWLQALAFVIGLGLLVYVIDRVGVQPIFDALLRVGFGFAFVL